MTVWHRTPTADFERIAQAAAALVVDEGLDYGAAKRRAIKVLGLSPRSDLPDNDQLEEAVREHLALFCADTQPSELRALRELALTWMQRLSAFRPYLVGAVWQGTATRLSDIHLQLFCDDPKSAEIALIDRGIDYQVRGGSQGRSVDVLSLRSFCEPLKETIGVHLSLYDFDDLRGALRPDARGGKALGDAAAVVRLLEANP